MQNLMFDPSFSDKNMIEEKMIKALESIAYCNSCTETRIEPAGYVSQDIIENKLQYWKYGGENKINYIK